MTSVPEQIGRYRILSVLGEGGMGTVYLAEQRKPVRRRVALKVIKLGMDSTAVLRRFEAERQALAMMEHRNIARVYEAGSTERGQPYFAMEYVKGQAINTYCDSHKLSLDRRLSLFGMVCSGVQHAHQKGVVHRDLTPRNVLVTVQDGAPIPKIIDFGIARATDHRLVEATLFTEQGQIIGIPEYMSPEQAGLNELDIDTRSDLYTLGVLLYELLVGQLPFSTRELREAGLSEMQRMIREEDPPKPSTRVIASGENSEQSAKLRHTDLRSLNRRLKGDLDWITMKALAKDRTHRYQSATELAQDIERHLAHEPVLASPPSMAYSVGKFARRYRGQMIGAAATLITLLAGIAGTTYFALEAEAGETKANLLASGSLLLNAQESLDDFYRYPAWPDRIAPMEQWIARAPDLGDLDLLSRELDPREGNAVDSDDTDTLQLLADELREFLDVKLAHLQDRLDWAKQVEDLTLHHPKARFSWYEASQAIRESRRYASVNLAPQMGLVPLGENPSSGFWEFYHLRSAEDWTVLPPRERDGEFRVTEETGIIFVLIPGGTFSMGAETDPTKPNFDPQARDYEGPPRPMSVNPFFLAKHEVTQGQWERLARDGENPSYFQPERFPERVPPLTLAHPVDDVNWTMCQELASAHGLRLPTGAEWEYACRAGTTTRYSTGNQGSSLAGYAHTSSTRVAGYRGVPVPVGSLNPNGWGLFDMHGNLMEWCDEPVTDSRNAQLQMYRGGSFGTGGVSFARSSAYEHLDPSNRVYVIGMRAARVIHE